MLNYSKILLIFVSINLLNICRNGFTDTRQGENTILIGFVEIGTTKIISDFSMLAQTPAHDLLRPSRIEALVKL